ncbi:hypothetical protein HDU93_006397 [Gonapodya sp. JEL0774]|nr:hypothetical protein HDU93_006397 [Gonapodya sp. JEL0774]
MPATSEPLVDFTNSVQYYTPEEVGHLMKRAIITSTLREKRFDRQGVTAFVMLYLALWFNSAKSRLQSRFDIRTKFLPWLRDKYDFLELPESVMRAGCGAGRIIAIPARIESPNDTEKDFPTEGSIESPSFHGLLNNLATTTVSKETVVFVLRTTFPGGVPPARNAPPLSPDVQWACFVSRFCISLVITAFQRSASDVSAPFDTVPPLMQRVQNALQKVLGVCLNKQAYSSKCLEHLFNLNRIPDAILRNFAPDRIRQRNNASIGGMATGNPLGDNGSVNALLSQLNHAGASLSSTTSDDPTLISPHATAETRGNNIAADLQDPALAVITTSDTVDITQDQQQQSQCPLVTPSTTQLSSAERIFHTESESEAAMRLRRADVRVRQCDELTLGDSTCEENPQDYIKQSSECIQECKRALTELAGKLVFPKLPPRPTNFHVANDPAVQSALSLAELWVGALDDFRMVLGRCAEYVADKGPDEVKRKRQAHEME